MPDEELHLKCLELAIECFSWFKDVRNGIRLSPLTLADIMYRYIKHGEEYNGKPYWPLL